MSIAAAHAAPTVDVHAHAEVAALNELVAGQPGLARDRARLLATFGEASTALNVELAGTRYAEMLALDSRLAHMDAGGVDVQAVSVTPTLYHYWADAVLGAEVAAASNEELAKLVASAPTRLVGLANVSLPHPEAAADQLRDATVRLGLKGVEISTSAGGMELSDRALDPFWATAEELGSFIFIHPWGCSLGERLDHFYLGNVVGNPTETTLALHHLLFGGVLDRFPGLRICSAHGGGYFPHYLSRADHAYRVRPESRTSQREPSAYLDRLWFDALLYSDRELASLIRSVGADRVVLGTDYPFDMGISDPVARLDALGLSVADRDAIVGHTAAALLGI